MMTTPTLYKLEFYVPETHLEAVKQAMFAAGAGRVGAYDSCAWQTPGQGQFRPLPGSSPHLGEKGNLEFIDEFKVEMVCSQDCVEEVVAALRKAHPYEEVAYSVIRLETF